MGLLVVEVDQVVDQVVNQVEDQLVDQVVDQVVDEVQDTDEHAMQAPHKGCMVGAGPKLPEYFEVVAGEVEAVGTAVGGVTGCAEPW